MQAAQYLIIACGLAALVYGLITSRQVLAQERAREFGFS